MERVIFRKEFDPYRKEWGYLAAFPDDPANLGRIEGVSFHFDGNDTAWFEPFGEMSLDYFYHRPIIHKTDQIIPKLIEALNIHYGYEDGELKVVERITRRTKR